MKRVMLTLAVALSAGSAYAGDCKISVTRTACAGKEAESYKKCNGTKSCDQVKKVDSMEACAKEALKACDNVGDRQKVTKSKVITALFDGKPVQDGKDFCAKDRPDFNKCD
jgi:hypothetical protein